MKFFYSPVELFSLITNSKKYSVADKVQAKWFFSKKGEQAYKEADVSKKTRLFYDYLSINRKENEQSNQLTLKMSYLLASGIAGSSLEYGSYPQIFDKEKNPFIKYFCDKSAFNFHCAFGAKLLTAKASYAKLSVYDRFSLFYFYSFFY